MKKLVFIFIDGIGIGPAADTNPFFSSQADHFPFYEKEGTLPCLPDGTPIKGIDACLGIQGMPMSATGQTTLFTGVNVPALLKEHKDSYPDHRMRKIIKESSIFSSLRKHNFNPRFLNAYPGHSHLYTPQHVHIRSDGEFRFSGEFRSQVRRSLSVTTCMMISNYMIPFGQNDILKERALFHDFSNRALRNNDSTVPLFSPEKAAEVMFNVSRQYDMILYEYFQTDLFGHGFEMAECEELILQLNRLVKHLVSLLDKENDTLLITSDHGNLEDSATQLHTYNAVPLIAWGKDSEELRERIHSLTDVSPAIVDLFVNNRYFPMRGG
jgi:hypothetical protein